MTRIRDIARILGRSEIANTSNSPFITDAPFDSAKVTSVIREESSPIAKYDSIGVLPTSGLTLGDRAFVETDSNNARFYISNGSGWYNAALVNISPTISLTPAGSITLSDAGATSTVTITAQDSDNPDAILSYSVESDGDMVGTGTTVSQDSSVFTIDPLTSDSGGVAGNFTLTFKVSDGIGFSVATKDFTLSFIGTATLYPMSNISNRAARIDCSTETMAQSFVNAFNECLPSNSATGINFIEFYNGSTLLQTAFAMRTNIQGVTYSNGGGPAYRSGSSAYLGTDLLTHWFVYSGSYTNLSVDSIKIQEYTVSNGQSADFLSYDISG